jgi:hypothetical protein
MEDKEILLEMKDRTALITINHPPANAWNLAAIVNYHENWSTFFTNSSPPLKGGSFIELPWFSAKVSLPL